MRTNFIFYNANPKYERIGDCVIRAISLALNKNYYDILYELFSISNYFNCDMIVRDCYMNLLNNEYNLKNLDGMGKTVDEVVDDFRDNVLIMRLEGHLTMSKYGDVIDTWDTRNEIVDNFWIVE